MMSIISNLFMNLVIERPAHKRSLDELIAGLERGGTAVQDRAAKVPSSPRNRRQLNHIIGIERWGQRRLRVALGEEPTRDEHDGYLPVRDLDLPALRDAFRETREETLRLAREIQKRGIAKETRVLHNQFGEITVGGWLVYLATHASFESKRLK